MSEVEERLVAAFERRVAAVEPDVARLRLRARERGSRLRRRRRAGLVGMAALVAAVGGVVSWAQVRPVAPAAGSEPVIAAEDEAPDQPLAEIDGRLLLSNGCLTVGGNVPIWPKGTTWDAGSETVVTADGDRLPVGTRVTGGGGYRTVDEGVPDPDDEVLAAALACARELGAEYVVLFYPG